MYLVLNIPSAATLVSTRLCKWILDILLPNMEILIAAKANMQMRYASPLAQVGDASSSLRPKVENRVTLRRWQA